jgi:hypothetical protein
VAGEVLSNKRAVLEVLKAVEAVVVVLAPSMLILAQVVLVVLVI